ncbi:pyridoxamine 5'-phosphate oxidase [Xanthomonas sp. XNM01]|uniref:pyridoxamine 5'-phosphate oxidase n=1 Tax=Xanthomonas sp. XNM01 TaxID=2769289 RepID=UPI0017817281|nr:pyridoxamine 5'-phosphate oxidase [Xanthomonas sp. XNM01]MBD9367445.1 pyridoxamine 5'-phosphate oxidase [Xanthomonas sp. XNM01]
MTDLYAEALATFATLFEEASAGIDPDPNAMTVATATAGGVPSARTVLLKSFDARGFVFYTHLASQKGRELAENPHAALLFLWRRLREAGIQVRVEGAVEQVDAAEADAYFASRPRMSQIGAWASAQSTRLASRDAFEQRIAEVEAEYAGRDVPRPPGWSGYRVVPAAFEFWYGAGFRLHERWRYERDAGGTWVKWMLYP